MKNVDTLRAGFAAFDKGYRDGLADRKPRSEHLEDRKGSEDYDTWQAYARGYTWGSNDRLRPT